MGEAWGVPAGVAGGSPADYPVEKAFPRPLVCTPTVPAWSTTPARAPTAGRPVGMARSRAVRVPGCM